MFKHVARLVGALPVRREDVLCRALPRAPVNRSRTALSLVPTQRPTASRVGGSTEDWGGQWKGAQM